MTVQDELRRAARSIFAATLAHLDARRAVSRALHFTNRRLTIVDTEFDLRVHPPAIYSIAIGKAGGAMALALDEVLGDALAGGVVSAPPLSAALSARWQVFAGGHPLPNEASLAAARAAFTLLHQAEAERALVIFLISGGGSAMLEWPREASITLAELREANRALVSCGASITEINAVRRALSLVKGGGLSARAPHARQVSLIISDTRAGAHCDVASGPTFASPPSTITPLKVVNRYGLDSLLPSSIMRALKQPRSFEAPPSVVASSQQHHVLLDEEHALARAAEAARAHGFTVEIARDISEQAVEEGAALLVSRLFDLHEEQQRARSGGRPVCLISGGEFSCPVRGGGVGGRNAETVLRCVFELQARAASNASSLSSGAPAAHVVALSAGTDGIDGNSPAAGASCDETTLARARALSLDARKFLEASDAHTFFAALGDTVTTGATGTNVRDLRVLVCGGSKARNER